MQPFVAMKSLSPFSHLVAAAVLMLSPVFLGVLTAQEEQPDAVPPVPSDPAPPAADPVEPPLPEAVSSVLEPPSDGSEPALPVADPVAPGVGVEGGNTTAVTPAITVPPLDAAPDAAVGELDPTELVLKDGRILKEYQIHSWNKTSLTIFHSTGAANVPAHLLPATVVQAYRMDPKLSLEQERANRSKRTEEAVANLRAMDERRALRKMPPVTVHGSVITVGAEGVVLQIEDPKDIASKGYQRIGGMIYDKNGKPVPQYRGQIFGSVWVTGHPLQEAVVDGDLLRFQGRVSGRQQVDGKTYPSIRFEKGAP